MQYQANQPLKPLLENLGACEEAVEWAREKTLQEIWATCQRGDWMLWLLKKANMCDLRTLTMAKARCAELARPWMKDPRSLAALQAAFDFANGLIGEDDLYAAAYAAAYVAFAAATAYVAFAAADAAFAAADAAAAAAATAAAAFAAAAATAAADAAARIEILAKCADICRQVVPNPEIK